jgi:MFS family permease
LIGSNRSPVEEDFRAPAALRRVTPRSQPSYREGMLATPVPVSRTLRHARLAVVFAFIASGAGFANWAARIPAVKDQLDLSTGSLGIALLGPAIGAVVAMPLAGALMVRHGSRRLTRVSLVLLCVALPLPAVAPSLPLLIAALVLVGIGAGSLDVSMNAQAVALERRYGRPLLAGLHGLWSLGTVTGALTGGMAAGAGLDPGLHLSIVALVLLTVGVAVTSWLLPADADRDQTVRGFVRPNRTLVILGAIAFCGLLSEGAVYDWSTVYMRDSLGTSEGLAVSAYAAFTLTMTVGRLVGDRARARFGSRALLGSATLVAAATLGAGLALHHQVAAVLGFAVLGAGLSCVVPIVFGAAGPATGLPSAPAIAAVSTVGYLGFIAGPPLIGAIGQLATLPSGLLLVVALTALIAVMSRRLPNLD